MGHTEASYTEGNFLKQLLGGLETTAGVVANEDCGVQEDEDGKPVIRAFADPASGPAPLKVTFSATGVDPDGGQLTYKWTLASGSAFGQSVSWTFQTAGAHTVTLTATDD